MMLDFDRIYTPGWVGLCDGAVRVLPPETVGAFDTRLFWSSIDLSAIPFSNSSVILAASQCFDALGPITFVVDNDPLAHALRGLTTDRPHVTFVVPPDEAPPLEWVEAKRDALLLSRPVDAWLIHHAEKLLSNGTERVAFSRGSPALVDLATQYLGIRPPYHLALASESRWTIIDELDMLSYYMFGKDNPGRCLPSLSLYLLPALIREIDPVRNQKLLRSLGAGIRWIGTPAMARLIDPMLMGREPENPIPKVQGLLSRSNFHHYSFQSIPE
jgi:hypothetical protein